MTRGREPRLSPWATSLSPSLGGAVTQEMLSVLQGVFQGPLTWERSRGICSWVLTPAVPPVGAREDTDSAWGLGEAGTHVCAHVSSVATARHANVQAPPGRGMPPLGAVRTASLCTSKM